ncbi:MAG: putative membrane protein [Sulfurimonas sp.]
MIRLFILGLLLLTTLSSNETIIDDNTLSNTLYENNQTISIAPLPKVLYINYEKTPERVIKGEIFSVTLKTLSTVTDFADITYELSNDKGLKLLNTIPYRDQDSKYVHDTFYFLTTSSDASLPDFTATLHDYNSTTYKDTTLLGEKLNVVTLNPKKDFSNIVADSFELVEYKTTTYDDQHNIVIFVATAQNCDISSFTLQNVHKQGIESMTESNFDSKIVYFAVINKKIENFSFSYFNLETNKFTLINIPIVVIDDSVTTQTDLKPKNQSHDRLKITIAGVIALIAILFIIWRKKYIYLIFIVIPLVYIAYVAMPSKEVCIKVGSEIYLLPMHNGTIFERTASVYHLQKEGSVKGFVKVKLQNEKIGWVKNEDICKN